MLFRSVLPAEHGPSIEFWEFCRATIGLAEGQAIFLPCGIVAGMPDLDSALASDDAAQAIASRLENDATEAMRAAVIGASPVSAADMVARVSGVLPSEAKTTLIGLADVSTATATLIGTATVPTRVGVRLLYPSIADAGKVLVSEAVGASAGVPEGYVCYTAKDVLDAAKKLGTKMLAFWPAGGSWSARRSVTSTSLYLVEPPPTGVGIVVCREQAIDVAADGQAVQASVAFIGNEILAPGVIDDVIVGGQAVGMRSTVFTEQQTADALAVAKSLLAVLKPASPGEFVFSLIQGKLHLVDVQLGELSSKHAEIGRAHV